MKNASTFNTASTMSSLSDTPPDDYFNDMNRDPPNKRRRSNDEGISPVENAGEADGGPPKAKRIACVICRKRKLKCDGAKPSCSTCTRLNHNCAYDEVRRKSGPKRGYVKALEERLKQVETLLKTQDPAEKSPELSRSTFSLAGSGNPNLLQTTNSDFDLSNPNLTLNAGASDGQWRFPGDSPQPPMEDMAFNSDLNMGMAMEDNTFTWEMIGLGLEEPLPPQETIDELHQIYFEKIHPSIPMIHKFRYLAAMNLAPNQRPPVALRYAMWTMASSIVEKYVDLMKHFYQRARKYLELDYLKGHGEHIMSVAHAQTHILLSGYEFKMMMFPRAWMSTGSAVRLCQMLALQRLDGVGLDVKQCLPPPRDWTEREERRRTFWMAFCEDRYASIGTGWPMCVDEKDILTNLPSSEEAFEKSKPEKTSTLAEALIPSGASKLSPSASVVLMACLFGRNLVHLHRPDEDDKDDDLNGEFWKRHRQMDNILLNTSLSLPSNLKLPNGLSNPNVIFTNMNIHTSTICLHQAAIYKADKNHLPALVSKESKLRCINAANEIASIMRMISHMDLGMMNPFMSFCLYVAARVFVQYLKSRPEDNQTGDSLRFLLSAMNALKAKNPLTESFLVQLDVDLESLGLRVPKFKAMAMGLNINNLPPLGFKQNADGTITNQCAAILKMVDDADIVGRHNNPPIDPALRDGERITSLSTTTQINDLESMPWLSGEHVPIRKMSTTSPINGMLAPQSAMPLTQYEMPRYGRNENGIIEMDISDPGTGHSDRTTPNSNTPSDSRSSIQTGQTGQGRNGSASFETSPASSHQPDNRTANAFFNHAVDYSNSSSGIGLTPNSGVFALPPTPGRGSEYSVPGGWDLSGQGLTPVGEGVFRELMGMGPMDLGWDGTGG